MKRICNILTLTDDNYAPYCGIMLTSVFENNPDCPFQVFILIGRDLKKRNVKRFRELENRYGCVIKFIFVDDSFLKRFDLNNNTRIPVETFYRLYASDLLPETIDRVLFLDCDIIVTGCISQLWELDLKDNAIAVVPDIFTYVNPSDYPSRLNYPLEAGTFSCGVMMMNLDYWRKHQICNRLLKYIENHYQILKFFDQDVMNAVLWDRKVWLPITYNFQLHFVFNECYQRLPPLTKTEILELINNEPIIIHFADSLKPWSIQYFGLPFRNLWIRYKKMSPWPHISETIPQNKSINWLIKRYILWPAGIMKRDIKLITGD